MKVKTQAWSYDTLLAELVYNNLLLRHFQLFMFPSVVCVNQLSLGLTLLLKCRVQKPGLDSRPPVLFDRFHQFILSFRATFRQSSDPSWFRLVDISNIHSEQAFHSINLSNVRIQSQLHWLKYFCVVMKTSLMLNRKTTKPRQSWYFLAKPTDKKVTSKREEREKMLALLAG